METGGVELAKALEGCFPDSGKGIEVCFVGTVGDSTEVADAKVNPGGFRTGWVWRFGLVLADDVKLPATVYSIVESTDLLDVLYGHVWPGFVFDQRVFPRSQVFFVSLPLREAYLVVLGVVFQPRPRWGGESASLPSLKPCCFHVTVERGCSSWTRLPLLFISPLLTGAENMTVDVTEFVNFR
jgi:hypothetical protein